MKSSYLPNQLPFLPGNSYADPTITRYHKTQLLGIRDGTITGKSFRRHFYNLFFKYAEKTVNLQENVNPDLLKSMREGVPGQLTGIP
jgi:hypothetical protein